MKSAAELLLNTLMRTTATGGQNCTGGDWVTEADLGR